MLGSRGGVRRFLPEAGVDLEIREFEESTKGPRRLVIGKPKDIENVSKL